MPKKIIESPLMPAATPEKRKNRRFDRKNPSASSRGVSLIVVMIILLIVSILGVAGIQISMMAERGTRNDRDTQIAWQAAEAALIDAEFDIEGQPATSTHLRSSVFNSGSTDLSKFIDSCGNSGDSIGLCNLNASGKPAWLTVDFTDTSSNARTTAFGTYTDRTFPAGNKGIQPAQAPRYVIEPIPDPAVARTQGPTGMKYVYRVTSMGFGPRTDIQVALQMIYRN
ncbi:pilus assembly PilX family protein [Extensimonas vulgaris]|uniref:Type IV pilus assembly protein PilX n=1 Tax=Extensimonas vulgaris TaxID=1031594 RepID=A0A369AKC1_9BURK|nr:PilX N-terminal domain-containing pilus assembly protein [Extensimonas vulgaris]RCX09515.1 type IV pilus assembly protein PilX [Extensimonas vulgaris]TWI38645.1 type IV pilus assembly protein PilX [Extensimonas vulgaris]